MKPLRLRPTLSAAAGVLVALCCAYSCATSSEGLDAVADSSASGVAAQVPTWSAADLDFFLHGTMGTEVVPERVLHAFVQVYPDLFRTADLSCFGAIPDPAFGWPVGFSRRSVPHLGGLTAVGINCAACHVGEVQEGPAAAPVRVLGMTARFDVEAFFGAVLVATFRTADPVDMRRYLAAYLAQSDPAGGEAAQAELVAAWQQQEQAVAEAILAENQAARHAVPGQLHELAADALRLDRARLAAGVDLAALSRSMLRLMHNMRAALHVPDQPPQSAPPASGPGRNDAFGLLSASLFGVQQAYAPIKFGPLFDLEGRRWVHWDGNTQSPIGRNLLAALGLGAPLVGNRGLLALGPIQRHTALTEKIRAPRYPFAIDAPAAVRGAAHYGRHCASCHDGPQSDARLHAVEAIGTDPLRAELFTPQQAERFNLFLAELEVEGYEPPAEPGIRSTQRYWAPSLAGVWARSPYLHNGSVRTMRELLMPQEARARSFRRGTRIHDSAGMGYVDDGIYVLDAGAPGNRNAGHEYGTALAEAQKLDLIEYLKTL